MCEFLNVSRPFQANWGSEVDSKPQYLINKEQPNRNKPWNDPSGNGVCQGEGRPHCYHKLPWSDGWRVAKLENLNDSDTNHQKKPSSTVNSAFLWFMLCRCFLNFFTYQCEHKSQSVCLSKVFEVWSFWSIGFKPRSLPLKWSDWMVKGFVVLKLPSWSVILRLESWLWQDQIQHRHLQQLQRTCGHQQESPGKRKSSFKPF
jgi:hypothetical protein